MVKSQFLEEFWTTMYAIFISLPEPGGVASIFGGLLNAACPENTKMTKFHEENVSGTRLHQE